MLWLSVRMKEPNSIHILLHLQDLQPLNVCQCVCVCERQPGNERWGLANKNGGQKVTAITLGGKRVLFPTDTYHSPGVTCRSRVPC